MSVWDPADSVPLRMTVTDEDGAPANTDSVRFFITAPNGDIGTPQTATNAAGTGLYDTLVDIASDPYVGQPGMYVWRAIAEGPIAGEVTGWFMVRARRTAGPVWTPDLDGVADWIPARTLSTINTPGEELYLGTFDTTTTPTDEQVSRLVDSAVAYVVSQVGSTVAPALYEDARSAASIVAAAYVELAYPARASDLSTYDRLWAQAQIKVSALADSNTTATGSPTDLAGSLLPQWSYPDPVTWGDTLIP